jgi:hypothetical protein
MSGRDCSCRYRSTNPERKLAIRRSLSLARDNRSRMLDSETFLRSSGVSSILFCWTKASNAAIGNSANF